MASEHARDLEEKIENIEYDMERISRWQQDNADEIMQMGQYFDYLGNRQLRQAFEVEQATGQLFDECRSASEILHERDIQQRESYRQGLASPADVQRVHTEYVNSLEKTLKAASAHELNMRGHHAVQSEYVELVRNNILAEEVRQGEMEKQNRLAERVRDHQPTGNARDPGGPSSSRRHDPSTRGHGTKKKKYGR
ncbi:hypothetical protein [Streptomyces sp. NPDC006285]|uniref:hypothetical protein n=1 Tax=Streptomyces sp. NPDC006285 TaxID=3364742 RepID=UPI003683D0EF